MADIDVHLVDLQVDPVKLKSVLEKALTGAEWVAGLTGQTEVLAVLKTLDGVVTQDWFIALVVQLLAIPDHLKPAAAEAMKAQIVGFQG